MLIAVLDSLNKEQQRILLNLAFLQHFQATEAFKWEKSRQNGDDEKSSMISPFSIDIFQPVLLVSIFYRVDAVENKHKSVITIAMAVMPLCT